MAKLANRWTGAVKAGIIGIDVLLEKSTTSIFYAGMIAPEREVERDPAFVRRSGPASCPQKRQYSFFKSS